jgi:hypothetical protein
VYPRFVVLRDGLPTPKDTLSCVVSARSDFYALAVAPFLAFALVRPTALDCPPAVVVELLDHRPDTSSGARLVELPKNVDELRQTAEGQGVRRRRWR